ncbi:MAG: hypothetical protein QM723_19020 [Myxococcaceae bacterium]
MRWGSWLIYAQHRHLEMLGPSSRRISPLFAPAFVKLGGDDLVEVKMIERKKNGALWVVQRDLCSERMRWVAAPGVTHR